MNSCTTRRSTSGRPEDNVQVRDIAEMVRDAVPGSEVSSGRRCRARPAQLSRRLLQARRDLPGLSLRWTVKDGIDELARRLCEVRLDLRRLPVVAVRAAAPDPRTAIRRRSSTTCSAGPRAVSLLTARILCKRAS